MLRATKLFRKPQTRPLRINIQYSVKDNMEKITINSTDKPDPKQDPKQTEEDYLKYLTHMATQHAYCAVDKSPEKLLIK